MENQEIKKRREMLMAEREVDTFKVNFDESLHKYKDDKDKKEK